MRTLLIALQGLRGAPVRSILIIVALTLGMLGIVASFGAHAVMRETLTQRAILIGGKAATVEAKLHGIGSREEAESATEQLRRAVGAETAAAMISDPDVTVWMGADQIVATTVTFATSSLAEIRPFPVVRGSWLRASDWLAPRVVVNEAAARAFEGAAPLLGTQEARTKMSVVGVIRDDEDDPHVYAELGDYWHFAARPESVSVSLHAAKLDEDQVRTRITKLSDLGAHYQLADVSRTDTVSDLSRELESTAQVLVVLGSLGLASAVAGILNVGLATAAARSREFALRRAMGAKKAQIVMIVMIESQILAIAAGLVAFGASFALFPLIVGAFGPQLGVATPAYDPSYGLLCLLVASVTAALSSLVPALMSYRRDLSGVMRE